MRYLALACDYDGTIAHEGVVSEQALSALRFLRSSGRRLLLVTGRRLDDLKRRVTRWTWRPEPGAAPPRDARVLRAGRRQDGYDLTLLDAAAGDPLLDDLRARGRLGEPASLSLEELFLDLTGGERSGILTASLVRAERAEVTA